MEWQTPNIPVPKPQSYWEGRVIETPQQFEDELVQSFPNGHGRNRNGLCVYTNV